MHPRKLNSKIVADSASLFVFMILMCLVILLNIVFIRNEQQFSCLAQAFTSGQLHFLEEPGSWADSVPLNGRYYWPLGPFPAVLLVPFVLAADWMGVFFYQGYLQWVLVALIFLITYRIARRIGYDVEDSSLAAGGFTFGTAFLGVALMSWAWYFAHVITVCLMLLAIYEFMGKRRFWLLGILFAMLLATRVPAALGIIGAALFVLKSPQEKGRRWKSLAKLGIPCSIALALLLLYNHARFGDPLEQGYSAQLLPEHSSASRQYGVLSPLHLPGNLYYLLIAAPEAIKRDQASLLLRFPWVRANPWGMSLFVTSPCFFWLFGLNFRDRSSQLLLATVVIILIPILFYYGVGYRQFGYRYSLDFLPLLFVLLLRGHYSKYGGFTIGLRRCLVISCITNFWLFAAYFFGGSP